MKGRRGKNQGEGHLVLIENESVKGQRTFALREREEKNREKPEIEQRIVERKCYFLQRIKVNK